MSSRFKVTKLKLENVLIVAWIISLLGTLGSLFFSETMKLIPCELCWYQRIAMYPQVIYLGIMSWKKDYQSIIFTLPISVVGLFIASYHYFNQKFANTDLTSCSITPCNTEYINWFGFITIPFLSLIAFSLLVTMQVFILFRLKKDDVS